MQARRARAVRFRLPVFPASQDRSTHRRHLIASALAAPIVSLARTSRATGIISESTTGPDGWRRFEITTRVALPDAPGAAQLWLPLAQTAAGYQSAGTLSWTTGQTSDTVYRVRDERYGAQLLRVDFALDVPAALRTAGDESRMGDAPRTGTASRRVGPDATRTIILVQQVATHARSAVSFAPLTMAERRFWTEPTPSAPSASPPPRPVTERSCVRSTTGSSTPLTDAPRRLDAALAITLPCCDPVPLAANAPTSTACWLDWLARSGSPHATSTAFGSRRRAWHPRWAVTATSAGRSIAVPKSSSKPGLVPR